MLNTFTGFGREVDEKEDPRYKSTFAKKPWESGRAGFSKYGDFLGFGNQAEEKPNLGGYQSPFTTLQKQGWQYEGNKLTSQSERDMRAGKFGPLNDIPKIGGKITQPNKSSQHKPTPYSSIIDMYKKV